MSVDDPIGDALSDVEPGTFVGLVPDEVANPAAGDYSASLQVLLAKKAAQNSPVVHRQSLQAVRDWSLELNGAGVKGKIEIFNFMPQALFLTRWFQMTDSLGGEGTRIVRVGINTAIQKFEKAALVRESNGFPVPVLTRDFVQKISEGYGKYGGKDGKYPMMTCHPVFTIWFQIEFLEDCEWFATLHGKAVL